MAEKMPISVKLGSRPMICRIRSYSSGLSPWAAIRSGVITGSGKLSSLTVQICTLIRKLTGRGKVGIAIKCRFCAKARLNWQIGSATAMWARQKKAGHMARRKSNREVMRRALGRRTHEEYLGAPSHPCKSCKRKAAMRSGHSYFCISRPRSARRRAMISSWTKSRKAAMRREWRNSSG